MHNGESKKINSCLISIKALQDIDTVATWGNIKKDSLIIFFFCTKKSEI